MAEKTGIKEQLQKARKKAQGTGVILTPQEQEELLGLVNTTKRPKKKNK